MPSFASSPAEAADILASDVRARLQEDDLLVVWLLDTSEGTPGKRQRMASGLEAVYRNLSDGANEQQRLLSALKSFGSDTEDVLAPTRWHDRAADHARLLPADPSGTENIFQAVEDCAEEYRRQWPDRNILIIAWTDESGDDTHKLEDTIRVCQADRVAVTVVGPMAVLGAEATTEPFVDSRMKEIHPIPVRRGPDSAVPQRMELGYWFLTRPPEDMQTSDDGFGDAGLPTWYASGNRVFGDHKCIAATQADLPTWCGDDDLVGLVSGFGPYALTRLSLQTGGTYIVLADEEHAGPFRPDALLSYLPDYRALDVVLDHIDSSPLRRAVMDAVEVTRGEQLGPPPTLFFGARSETPPYGFMRDYYSPERFAKRVKLVRRRLKTESHRTSEIVEDVLTALSQSQVLEVGLEAEYQQETSRRWRAWYDLIRGRLLATSVRLEEYRKTYDSMVEPGFLEESTNFAVMVPSSQLKSGSTYRYRAEEAERLLNRCVRENPGTPWAILAQRELDHALGIDVRQFTTTLVTMPKSYGSRQLILPKY